MQLLRLPHTGGHDADGSSTGTSVVMCRPGELVAVVDADRADAGRGIELVDRDAPVVVLDERGGTPRRSALRPLGGVTTVLLTDRPDGLDDLVDRIVVVYAGHVIEDGPAAQVVHNPRHPLTRRLLRGGRPPDPIGGTHRGCPYVAHCPLGDHVCDEHVPRRRPVADRHVACHYAELGPTAAPPLR